MPAADPPNAPVAPPHAAAAKQGASIAALMGVWLVFSAALFSIDNVMLDVAKAGWQKIQLIQGTFAPASDAAKLYGSTVQGKIRQYDPRIIDQAVQERQLKAPDTFKPPAK
jgi:hypothetical protein